MFERFTDQARRAVVLAQEEARLLDHNSIGTEHILLGVLGEGEGVAAKALDAWQISLAEIRRDVREAVGQSDATPAGHIPFTPAAKKVLELALREALQLGHNYIGTEHLLLGLIRMDEGVAVQVLRKRGVDLGRVRQTVIQLLSGYVGGRAETGPVEGDMERFERGMQKLAEEALASGRGSAVRPERGAPICPNCRSSLTENARLKRIELEVEGETSVVNIAYCHACGMALGIKVI